MGCTSTCCALGKGQQTQTEICRCITMQTDLGLNHGVAPLFVLISRALCLTVTLHILRAVNARLQAREAAGRAGSWYKDLTPINTFSDE